MVTQIEELNRKDWIVVPKEFSGNPYSLAVDTARLKYSPAVGEVGRRLGLDLGFCDGVYFGEDSLGRDFIGKLSWEEALKINIILGNTTLNLNEFVAFGKFLYNGMQGDIPVYNFSGKKLDDCFLKKIFDDIYLKRSSSMRSEWIDSRFLFTEEGWKINSDHVCYDLKDNLFHTHSELIEEESLLQNFLFRFGIRLQGKKFQTISLTDFLIQDSTNQGLPKKGIVEGDFVYVSPQKYNKDSVVRVYADFRYGGLFCDDLSYWKRSSCGVRGAFVIKE